MTGSLAQHWKVRRRGQLSFSSLTKSSDLNWIHQLFCGKTVPTNIANLLPDTKGLIHVNFIASG